MNIKEEDVTIYVSLLALRDHVCKEGEPGPSWAIGFMSPTSTQLETLRVRVQSLLNDCVGTIDWYSRENSDYYVQPDEVKPLLLASGLRDVALSRFESRLTSEGAARLLKRLEEGIQNLRVTLLEWIELEQCKENYEYGRSLR
jgi:hypothetical protein